MSAKSRSSSNGDETVCLMRQPAAATIIIPACAAAVSSRGTHEFKPHALVLATCLRRRPTTNAGVAARAGPASRDRPAGPEIHSICGIRPVPAGIGSIEGGMHMAVAARVLSREVRRW